MVFKRVHFTSFTLQTNSIMPFGPIKTALAVVGASIVSYYSISPAAKAVFGKNDDEGDGDGDGGDGDGEGDGGGGGGSRIGGNDRIHHRRRSYYEFVVEPEGFTQATYHRLLEASRRR